MTTDMERWVERVLKELVPRLADDRRFLNAANMVERFHQRIEQWRKDGNFQRIVEDVNEFATAVDVQMDY